MFSIIERKRGFTLVELLLGLIIFALVSVSMYNMLYNGIRLDGKSQYIHKTYNEARIAFDALARDLPNAILYDFSGSYPQQVSFAGKSNELTAILPKPDGIFVVRYYAGRPDMGQVTKTIIAGVVKNLKSTVRASVDDVPVDFLMRQEMSLPEFVSSSQARQAEIISAGLKKDGLKFEYAAREEKADMGGAQAPLIWKQDWTGTSLPAAVRVTLTLFDPDRPDGGVELAREIYLPQGNGRQ